MLAKEPAVDWYYTSVGDRNPQIYYNEVPQSAKASIGEIFVSVKRAKLREMDALLRRLRRTTEEIAGAQIVVKEFENGPGVEAPVAVRIFAEDRQLLAERAAAVEQLLRSTSGLESINNPLRVRRTDLRVELDRPKAALLGVPEIEVDRAVRLAFGGLDVSQFRESNGDSFPIQVTLPRGDRATLENWEKIQVQSVSGSYVPIDHIARLRFESAPPVIQRFNRERSVTVTARVSPGYNVDKLTRQVGAALSRAAWPTNARWAFGGEVESRQASFGGIGGAVLIAAFGILGVLVLEFRSFRGTAIVASVIPLGVLGGLVGLWLTGYTLSFTAAIGFVALIGIETKNSILLVDFTNQLRAQGVGLREAIERAGEIRFLPVVLTTLTALGALAPLALQGSGLYSPLAVVIMGGLLSSLLLSRLVTPVLYSLMPPPMPEDVRVEAAEAAPDYTAVVARGASEA